MVNKGTRSALGSGSDTENLLVQLKLSLSADGNIFIYFFNHDIETSFSFRPRVLLETASTRLSHISINLIISLAN